MLSKRPIVQIQKSRVDKLLEAMAFTCIAAGWIVIAVSYTSLPEIIPTHYDLKGNIDDHGAKEILWLLPLIFTALIIGIHYLNKHPHLFNYLVEINEQNAAAQYSAATRLIRVIQVGVAVIFLVVTIDIIESAKTGESFLGVWFIPVVLFIFIVPVIIAMLRQKS